MQAQFAQRPVEVEMRAEAEAVDRAIALLAEEDLIGVGLENLVLVIACVDDQGHQGLVELTPQ